MASTRRIERVRPDDPPCRCRCGQPATCVLVTPFVMGGIYRGTGRGGENRVPRCDRCVAATARRHGLDVPSA